MKKVNFRQIPEFIEAAFFKERGDFFQAHQLYVRLLNMMKSDAPLELIQISYENVNRIPNFQMWDEVLDCHKYMTDPSICLRMFLQRYKNYATYYNQQFDKIELDNYKNAFESQEIQEIELIYEIQQNIDCQDELKDIIERCKFDREKHKIKDRMSHLLFLNQWWLQSPIQDMLYFTNDVQKKFEIQLPQIPQYEEYSDKFDIDLNIRMYQAQCDYLITQQSNSLLLGKLSKEFLSFCEKNSDREILRALLVFARLYTKENQVNQQKCIFYLIQQQKQMTKTKFVRGEGLFRAVEDLLSKKPYDIGKLSIETAVEYDFGYMLSKLKNRNRECISNLYNLKFNLNKARIDRGSELLSQIGITGFRGYFYLYELPNYLLEEKDAF